MRLACVERRTPHVLLFTVYVQEFVEGRVKVMKISAEGRTKIARAVLGLKNKGVHLVSVTTH